MQKLPFLPWDFQKQKKFFARQWLWALTMVSLLQTEYSGGADTWATSTTIAGALRNIDYDLIITGRQAIDGDTAQVGPQISEHLGYPCYLICTKILRSKAIAVVVERLYDDRTHVLKAKMPCLDHSSFGIERASLYDSGRNHGRIMTKRLPFGDVQTLKM